MKSMFLSAFSSECLRPLWNSRTGTCKEESKYRIHLVGECDTCLTFRNIFLRKNPGNGNWVLANQSDSS